eukprot:7428460-Ditylum_brightwellii.AAC.1
MPCIFLVLRHACDCLAIMKYVLFYDGISKNGLDGVIYPLLDFSRMTINDDTVFKYSAKNVLKVSVIYALWGK